jgi:hypothetical protein
LIIIKLNKTKKALNLLLGISVFRVKEEPAKKVGGGVSATYSPLLFFT